MGRERERMREREGSREGAGEAPREGRKRRRKKKTHKIYAFFVLLLGCIIIAVAIFLLFYVQKITVKGNEYTTEQEIIEAVQSDRFSVNTLYILAKYALGKGEVLPCFERMSVCMEAPWSLKVIVEEKPIAGYIQDGEKYAYFDKEGLVVFESSALIEGVPYIEGMDVGEIKLYRHLKSDDTGIFEQILETSREVAKYGLPSARVVCEGDEICLDIDGIRICLGKSVSAEQIAQIPPILEKLGGREGTLHLENYSEMGGMITFETAEGADAENPEADASEDVQPEGQ